jgi:hypothetical protein
MDFLVDGDRRYLPWKPRRSCSLLNTQYFFHMASTHFEIHSNLPPIYVSLWNTSSLCSGYRMGKSHVAMNVSYSHMLLQYHLKLNFQSSYEPETEIQLVTRKQKRILIKLWGNKPGNWAPKVPLLNVLSKYFNRSLFVRKLKRIMRWVVVAIQLH